MSTINGLAQLKSMRGVGTAFERLCIEREISNVLENGRTRFDDIRQWGVDKGLIGDNGKATIVSQMGKLAEEYGELCTAIIDRDESGVIDGIGDCAVVLVLLAELCGLRFEDCVESAYREIRGRTGVMVDGVFVKDSEAKKPVDDARGEGVGYSQIESGGMETRPIRRTGNNDTNQNAESNADDYGVKHGRNGRPVRPCFHVCVAFGGLEGRS